LPRFDDGVSRNAGLRRLVGMLAFEAVRGRLMAIAYRMLGSTADAEDVVQDTWLRWQLAPHAEIRDPGAWLSTTLSRLCLDRLTSARARREVYPGTWLPEPVRTTTPIDVESIAIGFLVILERLTPIERAVFVLHRAFDLRHAEIATALAITEEASRQALHRATAHVATGKPRFGADPAHHRRLLEAFLGALATGDVAAIRAVLADDAVLYGDGGGRVRGAILRPVHGGSRVARFFAGLIGKSDLAALVPVIEPVNGELAIVGRDATAVRFVLTIETSATHIVVVRNIVNPDKLALPFVD
jgi:RNA polymerase sigma-70 factor, ECF subfamily